MTTAQRLNLLEMKVFGYSNATTSTTTTTTLPKTTTTTTTTTSTTTTTTVKPLTSTTTTTTVKNNYNTLYDFSLQKEVGDQSLFAIVGSTGNIKLSFDKIQNWIGLPINCDIYINNTLIMVITSRTDYLSKPFELYYNNIKYTSFFKDGKINF